MILNFLSNFTVKYLADFLDILGHQQLLFLDVELTMVSREIVVLVITHKFVL